MISLPNPTESQTLELSTERREQLKELLAERYLQNMGIRDLEAFFLEVTIDSLSSYADFELVEAAEDVSSEDEFQELLAEIANEA